MEIRIEDRGVFLRIGAMIFLKATVFVMGMTVFALCIFWLPWLANHTAEMFPEFAYLQYPVLSGLYVTTIPFFFALYQAWQLVTYIEHNNAFSNLSVKSLTSIKYCAIIISILYIIGSLFLMSQNALHPGIAIIGLTIVFASVVIGVFAAVIQQLLNNALDIKSENDFTI